MEYFRKGFFSAVVGHLLPMPQGLLRMSGDGGRIARAAFAGIAGGITTHLDGGKFANGAWTAAFVRLFNADGERNLTELRKLGGQILHDSMEWMVRANNPDYDEKIAAYCNVNKVQGEIIRLMWQEDLRDIQIQANLLRLGGELKRLLQDTASGVFKFGRIIDGRKVWEVGGDVWDAISKMDSYRNTCLYGKVVCSVTGCEVHIKQY